jgi:hypothetical protein
VDLRASLDDLKRKFLILPGLELRPLGRLAHSLSRYTDYAIPAPVFTEGSEDNLHITLDEGAALVAYASGIAKWNVIES